MELLTQAIGKYSLCALSTSKSSPSPDHQYVLRLEWKAVLEAEYYVLRRVPGNKEVARTTALVLYCPLAATDLASEYRVEAYHNPFACKYYQPPPTRLAQTELLSWVAPQLAYNTHCPICLDAFLPVLTLHPVELPPNYNAGMHAKHREQCEQAHRDRCTLLEGVRDGREKLLDGADLLFCGHAFHQHCLDDYRQKNPPVAGAFDVPCPLCKASWVI